MSYKDHECMSRDVARIYCVGGVSSEVIWVTERKRGSERRSPPEAGAFSQIMQACFVPFLNKKPEL